MDPRPVWRGTKALTSALQQYKYIHVFFFVFATTLLESICLVYLGKKKKKKN